MLVQLCGQEYNKLQGTVCQLLDCPFGARPERLKHPTIACLNRCLHRLAPAQRLPIMYFRKIARLGQYTTTIHRIQDVWQNFSSRTHDTLLQRVLALSKQQADECCNGCVPTFGHSRIIRVSTPTQAGTKQTSNTQTT